MTTTTSTRTFLALEERNFRQYMVGQAISQTGTWMQFTALSVLVLRESNSALAVSLVNVVQFSPILVLGAWAGALSDRLDRHRFLIYLSAASMVLSAGLAVVVQVAPSRLALVFALAFFAGIVVALENPVRRSFVSELVGLPILSNAVGLNATVLTITKAIGPATAGVLIAGPGLAWCFFVNTVSFVPQIVLFLRIDRRALFAEPRVPRGPGQIRAGIRYVRSEPELKTALMMTGLASMAYGNLAVLLPILTTRSFGRSSVVFTFLFASMSVGMMAGSLVVARTRVLSAEWLARRSAMLAIALLALAAAPSIVWAFVAAIVAGATYVQVSVGANAIVQTKSDGALRGRVLAILSILTIGTAPIGAPLLGVVAQVFGSRWAIAAASGLAAMAAAVGFRVRRTPSSTVFEVVRLDSGGSPPYSQERPLYAIADHIMVTDASGNLSGDMPSGTHRKGVDVTAVSTKFGETVSEVSTEEGSVSDRTRATGNEVTPPQRPHAVRVTDLVKHFRRGDGTDVAAVDGVSIDVVPGQFTVLLGPSGCGKTTLLRCIAGLEHPASGRVEIGGRTVFDSAQRIDIPPERRGINMIFQSYALWPHMTAAANVAFPLRSRRVPRAQINERVTRVLTLVGIPELAGQYPGQMSGGQQQRVALARALVSNSDLVLFDEPLSNVDAKVREQLRFELISMQRQLGFAAVYVTHDQVEAMELAHMIAVMNAGRVAQMGPPREVYEEPTSRYVAGFVGTINELQGILVASEQGRVSVRTAVGVLEATPAVEDLEPGAQLSLICRPERTQLTRFEPACVNRWPARVVTSVFSGAHTQHVVEFDQGKPFLVWRFDAESLTDGIDVWLSVTPSDLRAMPAERSGVD